MFSLSLLLCFYVGIAHGLSDPLILTDYIKRGDIQGGQNASRVTPFVDGVDSYSGYFTVDDKYDSNMFFWYFPADDVKAPIVVWLQGGPGSSSMFGLFYENGPLEMKKGKVGKREHSWSKVSNLIFIDNPVGTGWSFTNSSEGYVTDETQVGEGLYSLMEQFLTLFPHLQSNELYITGESYGGKYVPAVSYTIHKKNPSAKLKMNLKGMAIGDGFSDPINMLGYGEYLYQIGLIDENVRMEFQKSEKNIKELIEAGKYSEANDASNNLIGNGEGSLFSNVTGILAYYNYYNPSDDGSDNDMTKFFGLDWVKDRIHVGKATFQDESNDVANALAGDVMKSIAPWMSELADNYRMILYNGQLDIIVAYPLTVNFLRNLDWCGHEEYMRTPRKLWNVGSDLAGYTRTVKPDKCKGSITEILVRNAGHMVPHDQPAWAFDIVSKLVNNQDF